MAAGETKDRETPAALPRARTTYVVCAAFDCRGNPVRGAIFEIFYIRDGRRASLGPVPSSGERALPAVYVIPHRPGTQPRLEIEVTYGVALLSRQFDALRNIRCEIVLHLVPEDDWWTNRKGRRNWRCRCEDRAPRFICRET
jgi:hypothetical protein